LFFLLDIANISKNFHFDQPDCNLSHYSPLTLCQVKNINSLPLVFANCIFIKVLGLKRPVRKDLIFVLGFNKPICNLPLSVTTLYFGRQFNQSITNLPSSITKITFGNNFNSPVTFPPFLTHLTFGASFAQPISTLPPSLITSLFLATSHFPLSLFFLPTSKSS
jgi:hypothetical protein